MITLSGKLFAPSLAVAAMLVLSGCVAERRAGPLLEELKGGLASARALPLGSRPPPPEIDLGQLKGTSKAAVIQALGKPTYCGDEADEDCATSTSWKYEWGPPAPPLKSGNGFVEVTTGGPWVIDLSFTGDTVSSARWLGQR